MLRPSRKTKHRIFAALSINITCPFSAPKYADVNKTGGSILNANYPPKWVNFACLFTFPRQNGAVHWPLTDLIRELSGRTDLSLPGLRQELGGRLGRDPSAR